MCSAFRQVPIVVLGGCYWCKGEGKEQSQLRRTTYEWVKFPQGYTEKHFTVSLSLFFRHLLAGYPDIWI